jgi:hypothetical protein
MPDDWPPSPLGAHATFEDHMRALERLFTHPETIRRNCNVKARRCMKLVQDEDGRIAFVPTETQVAVDAALAELGLLEPEGPDVDVGSI